MPVEHVTDEPALRLCQTILYCGGTSGENVTVPVNPASAHFSWAFTVFRSTRFATSHTPFGVGVGAGVGGGGFGVGFGVGVGAWVGGAEVGAGGGGGGAPVEAGRDVRTGPLVSPAVSTGDAAGNSSADARGDGSKAEVELISQDSEEGQQLLTAFGGLAAILRYPVEFPKEK